MHVQLAPRSHHIERPAYAWIAVALETVHRDLRGAGGLVVHPGPDRQGSWAPARLDRSDRLRQLPDPGLVPVAINGAAMIVLAALTVRGHWIAPWLTGALGVGLIIWIAVEIVTLPETMLLTWVFLAIGFVLGFIALFWLRRMGQMRLW